MSKTELITTDHTTPPGSALDKSEHELVETVLEWAEAFVRQGVILGRIWDKEEYKQANFSSFREYCDERKFFGYSGVTCEQLVRCARRRHLLPDIHAANGSMESESAWTERAIRPLTHKDFTDADVRRLGKKIATRVKKGEKLTAKLVKEICDVDRGVERKKTEKHKETLAQTQTPAQVLRDMEYEIEQWQSSLGNVPGEFWTDADAEDPKAVKDLISVLTGFASFLKS